MWDRGDKVPAIAATLGCKDSAINVARARFGLKPRRIVSGRPRQEPNEPAHKIDRVAFTTSRLMEFASEKELVAQTGHPSFDWLRVIIKELVDNGIDACEEAGVAPVINVAITAGKKGKPTRIVVEDDGPGIPSETIAGVINYNVRVSSREAYISPTRGRQGNALKTILPMAYVVGGKIKGETWIEARGVKHRILFTVNQIKQEPVVDDVVTPSLVTTGTRVTLFWPANEAIDLNRIEDLLTEFIWVNPHLTLVFRVGGKTRLNHAATNPDWSKYRACDATSAHWYSLEQIKRYAGALIARNQEQQRATRQKYTVREFIAQFRGMSATDKQKRVLCELGTAHMSLYRFFGSAAKVNHERMEKLLRLLQQHTRPVRPELLGVIGEEHLRRMCESAGGEPKSFKYFISPSHDANGRPYLLEIATCPFEQWVAGEDATRRRKLITGINFSAALENPFAVLKNMQGMGEILTDLRAGAFAPVIVAVHYASPHMEECYLKASNNGLLPATARQIFYVARPLIEEQTGKPLGYAYFSQTLLPNYVNEHGTDWDVVYDDRGHFMEPHTNRVIGLGTLNIRAYLNRVKALEFEEADFNSASVKTYGPDGSFGALLYVEKEGFMPLFKRVKLAKRYDIGIMSSKGMSVTAARQLAEGICAEHDIPLFVLHDFDTAGIIIKDSLENDTRRYSYSRPPDVIDIGLRYEDIAGLPPEPNNSNISGERLRRAGLDQAAIDFLRNQRVELNAMTSQQLVDFVERKLKEHGVKKVLPDADTLAEAYEVFVKSDRVAEAFEEMKNELEADDEAPIEAPKNLAVQVKKKLKEKSDITWHRAVRLVVDPDAPEKKDTDDGDDDDGGDDIDE
jgi:hypothetical protein